MEFLSEYTDEQYPFARILQAAGCAHLALTADGKIFAANEAAAKLLGTTVEQLLTLNFFAQIPDDVQAKIRKKYQNLPVDSSTTLQSPIFNCNGELLQLEQVILREPPHIYVLLRDPGASQTQRKENLYRTLSQVESELTDLLNIDYVLDMALDAAVRLSEAYRGFLALWQDNHLQHTRFIGQYPAEALTELLNQNRGVIARVIRNRQAELVADVKLDPDYVPLFPNTHAQIVVPLISRDQIVGILNLEVDKPGRLNAETLEFLKLMTARVAVAIDNSLLYEQTVTQLNEKQALLEQVSKLEQLKTDMIRIASHDLRNPLQVIMSYTTLLNLELKTPSKTAANYLENIQQASQNMRKLITNILSLERIEELAQEGNSVLCDLGFLVKQAFVELRGLAQLKSLAYDCEITTEDSIIMGDELQLGEAITNLIANAIKYTPENGCIKVKLERQDTRLIFTVVDNGYGIHENQQARLFQPFYRAKSKETTDIEGSGLGLHLVKSIIEQHGGSIIFSSVYGEGSTFGFELNRYQPT